MSVYTIDCPKCDCEHEASGSHEDDSGDFTCQSCGFEFVVEIEYDPSYLTWCKTHEFDEWKPATGHDNWEVRMCRYCGKAEAREKIGATK